MPDDWPAAASGSGCSRPSMAMPLDRLIADGREAGAAASPRGRLSRARGDRRTASARPPSSRRGSTGSRSIRPTCGPPCAGASTPARPIWRSDSSRRRGATGRSSDSWPKGSDWAEAALAMPGADAPTTARVGALGAAGQHRLLALRARAVRSSTTASSWPSPSGLATRRARPTPGSTWPPRPSWPATATKPCTASQRRDVCMPSSVMNGASTAAIGTSRT